MPYNGTWGQRPGQRPNWGGFGQPSGQGSPYPPTSTGGQGGRPMGPPNQGTNRPPNYPPGSDPSETVPQSPSPGPRYLGPPVFTGPRTKPQNPGGGNGWPGQNPPPNQPPPAGPPAATKHPMFGGGRASPITMPDGTTAWIWNGKAYPYDPTAPENSPLLEDRNPFAPPWDPGQTS